MRALFGFGRARGHFRAASEHCPQANFENSVIIAACRGALKVSRFPIGFLISKLDIRSEFSGELIALPATVFGWRKARSDLPGPVAFFKEIERYTVFEDQALGKQEVSCRAECCTDFSALDTKAAASISAMPASIRM